METQALKYFSEKEKIIAVKRKIKLGRHGKVLVFKVRAQEYERMVAVSDEMEK